MSMLITSVHACTFVLMLVCYSGQYWGHSTTEISTQTGHWSSCSTVSHCCWRGHRWLQRRRYFWCRYDCSGMLLYLGLGLSTLLSDTVVSFCMAMCCFCVGAIAVLLTSLLLALHSSHTLSFFHLHCCISHKPFSLAFPHGVFGMWMAACILCQHVQLKWNCESKSTKVLCEMQWCRWEKRGCVRGKECKQKWCEQDWGAFHEGQILTGIFALYIVCWS